MSRLESAMADYLQLRRALGHELSQARWELPKFVAFLEANGAATVTVELALAWSLAPTVRGGPTVASHRMGVARGFARYLAGTDPHAEIPPLNLLPARRSWRAPFLFSPDDVQRLLSTTGDLIGSPLRAATYRTLFGLLAASGLRIGEAIKLDRTDIDWAGGVLLIRESKFGKSRLVPLHPSSLDALGQYAELRDRLQPRPLDGSFFLSLKRKRLIYAVVHPTFRSIITAADIGTEAPSQPRLHDLRHSFAIATLLSWYCDGHDVGARLPALSTYLGHREPAHTYWYLSAHPQLLALAAARQASSWPAVWS